MSEIDLLRVCVLHDARSHLRLDVWDLPDPPRHVSSVMTPDVAWVCPQTDLADVAELMVARGVRDLPVVEDGRPCGIVSRRDIIRTLVRPDAEISDDVHAELARLGSRSACSVVVSDGVVDVVRSDGDASSQLLRGALSTIPGVARVHVRDEVVDRSARAITGG